MGSATCARTDLIQVEVDFVLTTTTTAALPERVAIGVVESFSVTNATEQLVFLMMILIFYCKPPSTYWNTRTC